MNEILDAIDEYKNLAIECVLQENELTVKDLSEKKSEKLAQIMQLLKSHSKEELSEKDRLLLWINDMQSSFAFLQKAEGELDKALDDWSQDYEKLLENKRNKQLNYLVSCEAVSETINDLIKKGFKIKVEVIKEQHND